MKGSYFLIIKVEKNIQISIGKLGIISFEKGYYIYVGSGLNSLEKRINRHLRNQKKIHWHIDYLLKYGKIIEVYYKENTTREECILAKKLEKKLMSINDFGCSDCKCKSHLYYGNIDDIKLLIKNLKMKQYNIGL